MKKLILLIFAIAMIGCSNYSEGYRVGTVTKFSKKGKVFKSYEGELDLGRIKSVGDSGRLVMDMWDFSIDRQAHRGEVESEVAATIDKCVESGRRCKLSYNQEMFTNWFGYRGSTSYFVYRAEVLK